MISKMKRKFNKMKYSFHIMKKLIRKNSKNYLIFLGYQTLTVAIIFLFSYLLGAKESFLNILEIYEGEIINLGVESYFNPHILVLVSLMVLVVVTLLGFYSYQFFLNEQTKLLGIFKLSGVSNNTIIIFYTLQLSLILLISIPIGVSVGYVFSGYVNDMIFQSLAIENQSIQLPLETIIHVILIMGAQATYYGMISFGFVYRYEINELSSFKAKASPNKIRIFNFESKMITIVSVVYFIGMMIALFRLDSPDYDNIMLIGMLLVIPLNRIVFNIIIPIINKWKWKLKNTNWFIALSNLVVTISKTFSLTLFICVCFICVFGINITTYEFISDEVFSKCISIATIIIFIVALVFSIPMQIRSRGNDSYQLMKLGKTRKDIKQIALIETIATIISIIFLTMFIPCLVLCKGYLAGLIRLDLIGLFLLVYAIMIIILMIVLYRTFLTFKTK